MMAKIKRFFGIQAPKAQKSDFSEFFHNASSGEHKEVLMRVIKKANEDQRKVIEQYEKLSKSN